MGTDQVQEFKEALAELLKDGERLDWLDQYLLGGVRRRVVRGHGESLRDTIDRLRSEVATKTDNN